MFHGFFFSFYSKKLSDFLTLYIFSLTTKTLFPGNLQTCPQTPLDHKPLSGSPFAMESSGGQDFKVASKYLKASEQTTFQRTTSAGFTLKSPPSVVEGNNLLFLNITLTNNYYGDNSIVFCKPFVFQLVESFYFTFF